MSKLRPMGDIMYDLEVIIEEMVDQHDLQWGDIFGLIYSYLLVHRPDAREEYEDGSVPFFYYGSSLDDEEEETIIDKNLN